MKPSSYSLTMVRGDTFKFDLDLSDIDVNAWEPGVHGWTRMLEA